jgi:CHAT domain-containing protein
MPSRKSRKGTPPAGVTPFDHPYYWAAFILVGDPS